MGKSSKQKKKPNVPSEALSAAVEPVSAKRAPNSSPPIADSTPGSVSEVLPTASATAAPLKMEHLAAVFLRRALELKEEGNSRFSSKDYQGAMENYEQALRLIPRSHPDRAVFHSNRAACLMQMKPVQYEAVVRECNLALEARPCFGRALFRRARASEALGRVEFALQDVQLLLQADANNSEALEMAKRLRMTLKNREENHGEANAHIRPVSASATLAATHTGTSPAAVGASVVNGSKGPPKVLVKKKGSKPEQSHIRVPFSDNRQNAMTITDLRQSSVSPMATPLEDASEYACVEHSSFARGIYLPLQSRPLRSVVTEAHSVPEAAKPQENREFSPVEVARKAPADRLSQGKEHAPLPLRPLKLIYDHDIRLAKMPCRTKFRELRELIRKRFPSSKAVLIKYKDSDGDLITITSSEELRLAETALEAETAQKNSPTEDKSEEGVAVASKCGRPPSLPMDPLRLYIVEVPLNQEPIIEDEEEEDPSAGEGIDVGDAGSCLASSKEVDEMVVSPSGMDLGVVTSKKVETLGSCFEESIDKDDDENRSKEIEMDDWLVDFAQLFRTHIGVDPDVHVDLHDLGIELCSEALEEAVTSEEAQPLFEAAACKFQEVAALAFFNWGNVYMCAARKRIPLDGTNSEGEYQERLRMAYDWAQGQYEQAKVKYEEALKVKPDFYEGVLALGQESFESAKLRWSLAIASQVDLTTWDSSETLNLFSRAEERMQIAFGMWEKLEELRLNEAKNSHNVQRDGAKPEVRGHHRDAPQELSEAETKEHFQVMRLQINLFWGNILFEHSQVQYKLGIASWKALLDAAVKKFELAGASPTDINVVMSNHISNSTCSCEAAKPVIKADEATTSPSEKSAWGLESQESEKQE